MVDVSLIVVMVMLSLFSICGTVGNSLVLYIYSHKKEKSTAGIFIMSLAGTDLFTCLVIMPYSVAFEYLKGRVRYDAACKIYMFFITCNIPLAALLMAVIAIDRYFCICHPFWHVLNIQRSKTIVLCLLLVASTFGIVTSLSYGVYKYQKINSNSTLMVLAHFEYCVPNDIIISREFWKTFQQYIYAGTYILSFIVVVVLYGMIYRFIYKHRAKWSKLKRRNPAEMECSRARIENRAPSARDNVTLLGNIRTAAMLFAVAFVFLIAFLPAWLMASRVLPFNLVVFYMYFVNNAANPFIYAFMSKSFRDDLRKVINCRST